MQIEVPKEYPFVLAAAVALGFTTHANAFLVAMKARIKYFNKEFMEKNFAEIHEQEIGKGEKVPKAGYPDMGNGYYSQKLSYKDWYHFNNAQRVHYNLIETIGYLIPTLLIAGIKLPIAGAALGFAHVLGRILFAIGYSKGPNYRVRGAQLSQLSILGIFGCAFYAVYKLIQQSV